MKEEKSYRNKVNETDTLCNGTLKHRISKKDEFLRDPVLNPISCHRYRTETRYYVQIGIGPLCFRPRPQQTSERLSAQIVNYDRQPTSGVKERYTRRSTPERYIRSNPKDCRSTDTKFLLIKHFLSWSVFNLVESSVRHYEGGVRQVVPLVFQDGFKFPHPCIWGDVGEVPPSSQSQYNFLSV